MAQEAILEKVNGEVHISKSFDFMCSQLRNGRYRVKIERFTEPRTLSQNALMWLWFTCIEQETGTDKQDVHDYYCNRFLRRTSYFRGKEMVSAGSTYIREIKCRYVTPCPMTSSSLTNRSINGLASK